MSKSKRKIKLANIIFFISIILLQVNAIEIFETTGNSTPISQFRNPHPFDTSSFIIKRSIYNYIKNNNKSISIAFKSESSSEIINYSEEISIDTNASENFIIASINISNEIGSVPNGTIVAYTDAFLNDLPIVTHWDSSIRTNVFGNIVEGGFREGAHDGLSIYDIMNTEPFTEFGEKYWKPYKYNIFDNSNHLYKDDMATEQYIGEEYSYTSKTNIEALSFTNGLVSRFGYPVIIKNNKNDIEENIPAFQILNCVIHRVEEIDDNKGSLATYILPPFWHKNAERYPVLFTDFYDLNATMYGSSGKRIINAIGKLDSLGYGFAVGVVFNSGSSYGSFGINESAYKNMINVTTDLYVNYCADINNIIAFGSSRGGNFSLALASNPFNNGQYKYNVKFALTFSPPTKVGDILLDNTNPTYPALNYCLDYTTGYKGMWHDNMIIPNLPLKPQNIDSRKFFCNVITGSDVNKDTDLLRNELNDKFFIGESTLNKLLSEGTKIIMVNGTHDSYFSYGMFAEFEAKAKAKGIPLRHEIIYMGGHCSYAYDRFDNKHYLTTLLKLIKTDNIEGFSAFEGTHHYDNDNNRLYPNRQPVFFEGPMVAFLGKRYSTTIVGPPGTEYRVHAYKINDQKWEDSGKVELENAYPINVINPGTLPYNCDNGDTIIDMSWKNRMVVVPVTLSTGYYKYVFSYKAPDDLEFKQISKMPLTYKSSSAHPYSVKTVGKEGPECVVKILAEEPMLSGYEFKDEYANSGNNGWGLSEK